MSKLKLLLFFLLIFYQFNEVQANDKSTEARVDSLIEVFMSDTLDYSNPYRLNELCGMIDSISTANHYAEGIFFAHLSWARIYSNSAPEVYAEHFQVLDSLCRNSSQRINSDFLIDYILLKGYTTGTAGDFLGELQYYLLADSICELTGNTMMPVYVDKHLLNYYHATKNYEAALALNRSILTDYYTPEDYNDESYLMSLGSLAVIHSAIGNLDSSNHYFKLAIERGVGNYRSLHHEYYSIAKNYHLKNELDSTERYLNLAFETIGELYDYTFFGANLHYLSGDLAYDKGDYKEALDHYETCLKFSDSTDFIHGRSKANRQILITELTLSNRSDLTAHFLAYEAAHDSISARNSRRIESEMINKYQSVKKQAEIDHLKFQKEQDRKKHDQEKRVTRLISIFLVVILLILIVTIVLLSLRHKNRQLIYKQEIELENLQKKEIQQSLILKERELSLKVQTLNQNSETIGRLENELKKLRDGNQILTEMTRIFDQNYIDDDEWNKLMLNFDIMHQNALTKLREEFALTHNDCKLYLLIKLGYTNPSIAKILNISYEGARKAKQRLKKKVDLNSF